MKSTNSTRPVRIFLAMADSLLPRAIRQILPIIGNEHSHIYVEKNDEADLTIFTRVQEIEMGYSKEKFYAFLDATGEKPKTMPENCVTLDPLQLLISICDVIETVRSKMPQTIETPTVASPNEKVSVPSDAFRILVIDDTPKHLMSARKCLAGYHLTTINSYEGAMEILKKEQFDVVLTDLHLPMSSKTMGSKFRLGELVPYGILLMIEAAHRRAKCVAVVTDLSHHDDPFSAAFDHFSSFPIAIENTKVIMIHAPMKKEGDDSVKDWKQALDSLVGKNGELMWG